MAGDDVPVQRTGVAFFGHGQALHQLALRVHPHHPGAGARGHGQEAAAFFGHDGVGQGGQGVGEFGLDLALFPIDAECSDLIVALVHAPAAGHAQAGAAGLCMGQRRQAGGSKGCTKLQQEVATVHGHPFWVWINQGPGYYDK